MTYETIRQQAYEANMKIPENHLALYTWGNVSAFDKDKGVFAIKPSGVPYPELTPESMVIIDLDGKKVDAIYTSCFNISCPASEIIIPEGITKIEDGAFRGNARLSKLTIASTVKSIGNYAFQNCDALETVVYNGNKKNIKFGEFVFRGAYFLHPDFSSSYKKGIYYYCLILLGLIRYHQKPLYLNTKNYLPKTF